MVAVLVLLVLAVSGYALHQFQRMDHVLTEFAEIEVPLAEIVTEARMHQLQRHLSLEMFFRVVAWGGEDIAKRSEAIVAAFDRHGSELASVLASGEELAAKAQCTSSAAAQEYRDLGLSQA